MWRDFSVQKISSWTVQPYRLDIQLEPGIVIFSWFKGIVKENKSGIGWNLRISGVDRDLQEFYLMFLSREIYIKLCQN